METFCDSFGKMATKSEIFDLFYQPHDTVRSGGGKVKTKMARKTVTKQEQLDMQTKIGADQVLMDYFDKLLKRNEKLAPPPRPSA